MGVHACPMSSATPGRGSARILIPESPRFPSCRSARRPGG